MAFRKTSICDVFEDEPLTPEIEINDYRKKLIADPYFWVQGSPKSKRKTNTLVKDNSKSKIQNGINILYFCLIYISLNSIRSFRGPLQGSSDYLFLTREKNLVRRHDHIIIFLIQTKQ